MASKNLLNNEKKLFCMERKKKGKFWPKCTDIEDGRLSRETKINFFSKKPFLVEYFSCAWLYIQISFLYWEDIHQIL